MSVAREYNQGMRRRVFTIAAAVSALLFVVTAVLLLLSYVIPHGDIWFDTSGGADAWRVWMRNGEVGAGHPLPLQFAAPAQLSVDKSPVPGFRCARTTWSSGHQVTTVTVSLAYPLVLTGILPAIWLVWFRRFRRWRMARSLCATCGYDLRASAGTCPECGAAIEAS